MRDKRKTVSPSKAGTLRETASKPQANNNLLPVDLIEHLGNSTASQKERVLHHLKPKGALTTLQARHSLEVMHPGMRVCELRKAGYTIETVWVNDVTPEGNQHRLGQYLLSRNPKMPLFDTPCNSKEVLK